MMTTFLGCWITFWGAASKVVFCLASASIWAAGMARCLLTSLPPFSWLQSSDFGLLTSVFWPWLNFLRVIVGVSLRLSPLHFHWNLCFVLLCPHHSSSWSPRPHFHCYFRFSFQIRFWFYCSFQFHCLPKLLARLTIRLFFLEGEEVWASFASARGRVAWGSRACRACSYSSSRSGSRLPRTSGVAPSSRRLWWATEALALIHSRDIIECQKRLGTRCTS